MLGSCASSLPCLLVRSLPQLIESATFTSLTSFYITVVDIERRSRQKIGCQSPRTYLATSTSLQADALQENLVIVPMPQLSPHMTSGSIRKWLKKPGEEIVTYDVIMEVNTDSLSEEAYKVGDFAGTVTMLVEAQEDGFLSKILVQEGEEVDVHTPVATMCESERMLEELSTSDERVQELLEEPSKLRHLTWQSYLKDGKEGGGGGCG